MKPKVIIKATIVNEKNKRVSRAKLYHTDSKGVKHQRIKEIKYENKQTIMSMCLTSVIIGLKELNKPSDISIYINYKILCSAFNQGWLDYWKKDDLWRTKKNEPVKHKELWQQLLELLEGHDYIFINEFGGEL